MIIGNLDNAHKSTVAINQDNVTHVLRSTTNDQAIVFLVSDQRFVLTQSFDDVVQKLAELRGAIA